jgi:N-terminal domain of toast_rack, DUF2154
VRFYIILACSVFLSACEVNFDSEPGTMRTIRESVDRKGAEMVRAEVTMGAGSLNVSGGAKKLLEAEFKTDRKNFKPEIRYDVSSFRGVLSVGEKGGSRGGNTTNDWTLRFDNETPLDLHLTMGAGENKLNLKTLSLRRVEVMMGVGEVDLDVSGDYKHSVEVSVHGGVGQATVHLPRNIGVRVDAKGGIGEISTSNMRQQDGFYVNGAYAKHNPGMNVEVRGGVGEIKLVVD